ncbi:oxidoreductase [Alteriqipengyuania lutimaris]|uniref:Probable oxidoreductase n=1 Tax=Alteriqipengyuania lutimaris TaxID=1538146 RepID=A0A395LN44_9SPHN|nr:oxidoreductase [Alteriqipengyuania lutimaris]MBB3034145.1 NAD(P)-dependent dehydrogenase (short-subunit alcohol dehydrogenase family) [Alteriqipengyuania lutimaris]RDS76924.1 SDR family NAD(P)-dependent oxidoreductase [Alteriqipengyuania lutimaris]
MPDQRPTHSGFGRTSEPQDVLEGIDLAGKVAIVTGGYSGLGVETVRGLAGAGAKMIVPARNHAKAVGNLADVQGDVSIMEMDLADLASVRKFAADFAAQHDRLDLLINNAGIMACPLTRVGPEWEQQFGVNHLGHFALATALMPLLEKTAKQPGSDVRLVALSSTGHKLSDIRWDDPHWTDGEYDKWKAYGQAKTANALFAVGMNKRLAEHGGRAFSVHPGGIMTPLQRHLDKEEMVAMGWMNEDGEPSERAAKMFKSVTQGASTTLWAATSPALKNRGGEYCEDCDIAALADADEPSRFDKVQPYAVDEDSAERLWAMSEEMVAEV